MTKNQKSFSTEKHFTTVPKTKSAETLLAAAAAATVAVATPVVAAPASVVAGVAKTPVVIDIRALLVALRDLDADVAREAATSLGGLGNTDAVEPLIQVLKNSEHYFHSVVRSAAAVSLGQLKDRRAVEPLLDAVNDPIADPSTEAIRALVTLADPRAIHALIEVVRNSGSFFADSVRRAAVLGLINLGGDSAKAELRRVAADSAEDSVIRGEAAAAVK